MANRTDEVKVGFFVLVALAILIITIVLVGKSQVFGRKDVTYQVKLKFAGGVEPGTVVRFAGIKAGRVSDVRIDPDDNSRVLLALEIKPETPIKTDSVAAIQTLGLLGDNYVEVSPGSKNAAALPSGGMLQSKETVMLAELFDQVNALSSDSKALIANLNEKLNSLSDNTNAVLSNVNSVLNESNKRELANLLKNGNGLIVRGDNLIDKTGPKLDATLANFQEVSAKLTPMLNDVKTSMAQIDVLVKNLNTTVDDLHPDLKADLQELKKTETNTEDLLVQVQELLRHNRNDIDEIVTNLARSSRNVENLTDTLKNRPYTILGIKPVKDRKVPGGK
ncbi:MAG TPA: MlaD family protein [Blastocatellia bacterium]|nr:MlaD family protein [Blastocatellia bacterium]